jgi:hypothetical protein
MGQTITIKTTLNSNIDSQKFEEALNEYKNSHMMLGSLYDASSNDLYLDLKDVACKYNDLGFENGNLVLVSDVNVLDTPNGKLVQALLDNGFNFDLKPRMTKDLDGNYNIISIDLTRKI